MAELMEVLDFILNRCSAKEMDAIDAAVKRRKNDLGSGMVNPQEFAKKLSRTVSDSINTSISGLQESLKDFAWDLVQKENPNLTEDELNHIVNAMIPDILASKKQSSAAEVLRSGKSLVVDGKVNGVPVDAMLDMVLQFISFSNGTLPPEQERALCNAVGDWSRSYWQSFPESLQSLIRSYLKQEISGEVFQQALLMLLGK